MAFSKITMLSGLTIVVAGAAALAWPRAPRQGATAPTHTPPASSTRTPWLVPAGAPARPAAAPGRFEPDDDAPEAAPGEASPELRLVVRAGAELERLEKQQPAAFLEALVPPPERPGHDAQLAARVQASAGKYIAARTAALREMTVRYIEREGDYVFADDLRALDAIDESYRAEVADLVARVPQIQDLPDILGSTALPLPTFAREAAAGERVEYEPHDNGDDPRPIQ